MTKVLVNYLKRKDSIELRFYDHFFIDRPVIVAELDHEYVDPIIVQNGTYLEIFEKEEYDRLQAETIAKLKDIANWAANSCNKQPIRIFVANEQDLAKKCLSCCVGGTGFGENIPSFWCFTANVRGYVWPTEMYLPSVDTSLGAQNVFLAAQTMGITGTILSWGQHTKEDDIKLRKLLDIPEDYAIIFCAVMGYAEYGYLAPIRKNNE